MDGRDCDVMVMQQVSAEYAKKTTFGTLNKITHVLKSKEEGKEKESIQSNTVHNPEHHIEKCQNQKKTSHTREPRGQPLPSR